MKPWIIVTSIVITCVVAVAAWAERNPEMRHHKKGADPSHMIKWLEHHPEKAAELGVTEDQLNQVKDLFFQAKKNSIQMRADAETAQLNVKQLLDSDAPDKAAVMAAVDNAGAKKTEMHKAMIGTMLEVRTILGKETLGKIRQAARKQMASQRGFNRGDFQGRPDRPGRPDRQDRSRPGNKTSLAHDGPPWMQDQMKNVNDVNNDGV